MCQNPAAAIAANQTSVIGPKRRGHLGGTPRLYRKQRNQNDNRDRHNEVVESRCCDFQAFDRRQDRQRRCDDGIAVKQCAADDSEQNNNPTAAPERPRSQRHQRQRAALPIVVGAQQDQNVFGGNHQ